MGAAPLPRGTSQVGCDRLDQAGVGVAGHEPYPGQAAGDQVGEELVPRRTGLSGGHAHPQDLAVAIAVHAGGQQHRGVDDPAALADLHRQRIGGDEGERASGIEGTGAKLLDVLVELGGHPRDLRLRQRVDAEGLDQLVHPPRANASEVAVRDDGDQRGLCALAALEQPFGEVGALAELGDRHIDGADAGVEVAVAVAVALRGPARGGAAVLGADHGVGVRREQRVDHRLQQLAHQIRRGFGEGFAEQACRVDNVRSGHRDDSVRECCERFTRRITRWPLLRHPYSPVTISATALHHYRGLNCAGG